MIIPWRRGLQQLLPLSRLAAKISIFLSFFSLARSALHLITTVDSGPESPNLRVTVECSRKGCHSR